MSRNIINIENCNNINTCSIGIEPNCLNIKYAINGTGKSTIAKAIQLKSENKSLDGLIPFIIKEDKKSSIKPLVSDLPYTNIKVFNEDYLSKFVYQKNELLKDSFEVFIKTQEYTDLSNHIEALLIEIKAIARDKESINNIKEVLSGLIQTMALTKDDKLSLKSKGVKSIFEGKGALFNPPESIANDFKPFIDDTSAIEWASWKLIGIQSFNSKQLCPYCAVTKTPDNEKQNNDFLGAFSADSIKYTDELRKYLLKISEYIEQNKLKNFLESLNSQIDRNLLQTQLVDLSKEAQYIFDRLNHFACFNGYSIDNKNLGLLKDQLTNMLIDKANLSYFQTPIFENEVDLLNNCANKLINKVNQLQGEIGRFQRHLVKHIKTREKDINRFFTSAGYSYRFVIKTENDNTAHALLYYENCKNAIPNPIEHLSWGEKNALALILFMFDAISKKADLIILDDPISSFDNNKKYAIINRLFNTDRKNSLNKRTVLLLTHDLEPIIDYIQVGEDKNLLYVDAHYLHNKNGSISEQSISKNVDMLSTTLLMKKLSENRNVPVAVRISSLRKYIEHTSTNKNNSLAYNILSSLIHGREYPTFDAEKNFKLSPDEIVQGTNYIQQSINDFDYNTMHLQFQSSVLLKEYLSHEDNWYYQIVILRTYIHRDRQTRNRLRLFDNALRKYIDEQHHIENDYMYTFDVQRVNIIPQFIIEKANKFVENEIKNYIELPVSVGILNYSDDETEINQNEIDNFEIDLYDMPPSAGIGLMLLDTLIEKIKVDIKCDFAVRISGDSMQPDINNKDVLLIRESKVINHNKVGIFRYNGEFFCKRFFIDRENEKVYLKSDNEDYDPIEVDTSSDDFSAIGEVIGKHHYSIS